MYSPASWTDVQAWSAADLQGLPRAESDLYEYKSSATRLNELAAKISRAASGFWNAGGGVFIAGVDGTGTPDGGIPEKVGNQDILDWADRAVSLVTPAGPYARSFIRDESAPRTIRPQHGVLVIGFGASDSAPHMNQDHRYYVRVGAHTDPASHFLVEAIRAVRGLRRPDLQCLLGYGQIRGGIAVDLSIVASNDAPALDVKVDVTRVEGRQMNVPNNIFPKRVPLIDRLHPYQLRLPGPGSLQDSAFQVLLEYRDVRGGNHTATLIVDVKEQLGPAIY